MTCDSVISQRTEHGYCVIHDEDEMESEAYTVINKEVDSAKSFAFMSETARSAYQVKLDEREFPYRKKKMVEQYLLDNSTDI
jgi:hypothetical protein